jgi:exosortase A-associated hydrolase 2
LIDLPGCGDSAGEFGDVTWESWRCAVCAAHRWLTVSSTRPIHVGGLRLGAVLALESAEQIAWKSILLLQPVIRGEEMVTQFLRVRVAFSGLRGDSTEKETTQKLRTRIAAGEKLEIGGFFLSPELAMAVDSIDLGARMPPTGCQIHWVETGRGEGSPASRSTVDRWHAAGAAISLSHVDVKPYWVHTRGLVQEYEPLVDEVARILGETAR